MKGCIDFIRSLQNGIYHDSIEVKFDFCNIQKKFRSNYSPLFTWLIKFRQSSEWLPLGIGAIIRTSVFVFFPFFISNGWRFKRATHPILGILVSVTTNRRVSLSVLQFSTDCAVSYWCNLGLNCFDFYILQNIIHNNNYYYYYYWQFIDEN